MKESIKRENIKNRKVITEIRYLANPKISDLKGELINGLQSEEIFKPFRWKFRLGDVTINNADKSDEIRETIYFDFNRVNYINSHFSTNAEYVNKYTKIYKIFKNTIGQANINIIRIGCRIQGTYSTKYKSFEEILKRFTDMFPNQFLYEGFEVKDTLIQINHANGMYQIGPIKEDDIFIKNNFKYSESEKHIGFAIDTDNFVSKDEKQNEFISDGRIKDVITASLSVEKFLFDQLSSL